MPALILSVVTFPLFGGATAAQIMGKKTGFMRDALVLFTMIKSHSFQKYSTINGRFSFYSHEEHSMSSY